MNQAELHQLQNKVEVIGTLKSKELESKVSMSNERYITGKLVVQLMIDGKIQEQVIEVFTMEKRKLFKGIETVMNEYKTIDQDGIENADRIRVNGSIKLKEYYNNQGKLVQYNEVRGMIFNRLDEKNDQKDSANASIETVVEGFEPILKDQLPTGNYLVKGFTVGWNGEVIELKDVIVGQELAQTFRDLYQPNSTGRLSFKLNSYVEEETDQTSTVGFGTTVNIEDTFESTRKYASSIEIIGGDMPLSGTKKYTPEKIALAKQSRKLKLIELQNRSNRSIPQTNNGFGQGATNQKEVNNKMPTSMGPSDNIPDF